MICGLAVSLGSAASSASAPAPAASQAPAAPGAAAASYTITHRYVLGGSGGWDMLTVDPKANRLYISRANRVMVMNTLDGSIAGTIPDTQGVHGIALAAEFGKGFVSNGRANTVTVFELGSLKTLQTIAVGAKPDAILYDPASKHVYSFNGQSQDISVIDPSTGTVAATVAAGGKPEFAVADGAGRIYFNLEDKSELGVIDSAAARRIAAWPLTHCEGPTGIALDIAHGRVFSACDNGVLVVTDAATGRHIAQVPIGKGPDGAAFDAQKGLVFSPNGADGTLTVIRQLDADHYSVVADVPTRKSARTIALDPLTHRVYLVAAQFGLKPPPTVEEPDPRAAVLDGTFEVLVLGE